MKSMIFHIWGPIAIHAYGVCIALGAIISVFFLTRDKKLAKIATHDQLMTALQFIIVSGYFGGRLGFLISESEPMQNYMMLFKFWEPGLSILGSVVAVVLTLGCYLKKSSIQVFAFLDRIALYAPIAQSFGRLGCFFAGCCYGIVSSSVFAVTYADVSSMAPLYVSLHPAQLYSAVILLFIFVVQYFYLQKIYKTAGVMFCSYVILISFERFLIDFIRWDRLFFSNQYFSCFSIHQWVAVVMMMSAFIGLMFFKK